MSSKSVKLLINFTLLSILVISSNKQFIDKITQFIYFRNIVFKIKKFSYFILIITFSISAILLLGVAFYSIEKSTNKKFSYLHKKGTPKLNQKLNIIQDRLLLIKKYSNSISGMTNSLSQYDEQKISNIFNSHFLKELGMFQLRLLHSNGTELIRYDLNKQNKIIKRKKELLQNKSDRYYYQEAKDILLNDIYFSKFDLNKENGKIEIPYKNTTRVIKKTKIANEIYYIVINYNLTNVFHHSLSTLLYDLFLIEKDNQINVHLDDKYSFSKQKNTNIFLKDLILYENQYISQKKLKDFPYRVVICIKKSKLEEMIEEKRDTILKLIVVAIIISFILSFILLYLLEKNLRDLNDTALKILKNEKYSKDTDFIEFKMILDDLELQYSQIQKSNEIISKNVIYSKTNLKGIIIEVSKAFCNISGYTKDELIGQTHNIIRHKDMTNITFKDMWDTIKTGKIWKGEVKNRKKDNTSYWVDATITPQYNTNKQLIGYMAIRQDTTSRKKVEELVEINRKKDIQIFEQSKMSQMGEMIGNIAHQWRQPLSSISTLASSIQLQQNMGVLDTNHINKDMDKILEKTQYLSEIIDTFRNFLMEKKELQEIILQDRIDMTLSIINTVLRDNAIEILKDIDYDNKIQATIISSELSEVMINIINNAKDILVERKIENPWVKIGLTQQNNMAVISIEDNAGGVPQDIIKKIFDPYFTTKHQSQGTGLGLHMSYKIVIESLNGNLYLENTKNGAKFFIELPLSNKEIKIVDAR